MSGKLSYEELKQIIRDLKKEVAEHKRIEGKLRDRLTQAETTIKKSQERQRNTFNEAFDGIVLTDAETGIIIYCNDTLLELVGKERSELIGKSQKILHPPEEGDTEVTETFEKHRAGKEGQIQQTRIITKNGEIKEVETKANRLELNNNKTLLEMIFRDISHRRRSEEALRKTENRYRTILESIEEGYYEGNLHGNLTFFNDSVCRMFGYTREELMGLNYREYMKPETAKEVYKVSNRVYTTRKPSKGYDWAYIKKDGTEIYVETSLSLIIDEYGEATGFRGILRDVTERKMNEEALRESEERYRTILDSIEESYFETDLRGRFTFFNDRLPEGLGYSREELMSSNPPVVYMTPESARKVYDTLTEVYKTRNPMKQVTYEIVRKDGSHGFRELSASLMRDKTGKPIGFRGIASDVTERKLAENALRESEEKYRTILWSIEDGYFEVDLRGNFTFFNDAHCRIHGYTSEELMGMNNREYMDPENSKKVYQICNKIYKTGKPGKGFQWEIIRKDGATRHVESNVSLMRNPEGKPIGFRGILRNISERKQTEEALKQRTSELEAAQEELVNKAMEAGRAQLSAMVLHNIGNAITPVKVHIEGMKTDEPGQVSHYLEKCYRDLHEHVQGLEHYINIDPRGKEVFSFMGKLVDTLKGQGERRDSTIKKIDEAVSYISEILTLQQSYAATEKETKERVDLNVLIKDALRMQTGALEKRGITVNRELDPSLPKLLMDKNKLMQVIVNFIKNSYEAIDEMEDRGKERTITFKSHTDNGKVSFEVKDNGIGIGRQDLDTVFEFGKSNKGSSGFGLYYCKMFVEANNGELKISSPGRGKGTTVKVTFEV